MCITFSSQETMIRGWALSGRPEGGEIYCYYYYCYCY